MFVVPRESPRFCVTGARDLLLVACSHNEHANQHKQPISRGTQHSATSTQAMGRAQITDLRASIVVVAGNRAPSPFSLHNNHRPTGAKRGGPCGTRGVLDADAGADDDNGGATGVPRLGCSSLSLTSGRPFTARLQAVKQMIARCTASEVDQSDWRRSIEFPRVLLDQFAALARNELADFPPPRWWFASSQPSPQIPVQLFSEQPLFFPSFSYSTLDSGTHSSISDRFVRVRTSKLASARPRRRKRPASGHSNERM